MTSDKLERDPYKKIAELAEIPDELIKIATDYLKSVLGLFNAYLLLSELSSLSELPKLYPNWYSSESAKKPRFHQFDEKAHSEDPRYAHHFIEGMYLNFVLANFDAAISRRMHQISLSPSQERTDQLIEEKAAFMAAKDNPKYIKNVDQVVQPAIFQMQPELELA